MYNQFDHKCPFCGKYHEQPHYKRSRHDRHQRRDCPFVKQKHPKQSVPQVNHPCHIAKGENDPRHTIGRRGPAGPSGPTGATGITGAT
ncbi:collagen-like protein, partial [Bacillus pumilus]